MGRYFKTVVKSRDGEFKVYSGKVIVNGKAETEGFYNGLSCDQIEELCFKCRGKGRSVTASDFNLAGLYLINHNTIKTA